MIILVKLWNNNESKQRTITSCMRNLKAANQFPLQYNTLYEKLSKEVIALISTNVTHPPLSQKCLVSGLVQLRLWLWWRTWASEKYMTTTRTPLTTTNNDIWFSNRKKFRYVKMKINECNAIISFFQLIPRYLQETKKKKTLIICLQPFTFYKIETTFQLSFVLITWDQICWIKKPLKTQ